IGMEVKLMLYIIVTIVTISVISFLASFFMSNRFAQLEDLLEHQSLPPFHDVFASHRTASDSDERIQTNAYVIDSTGLADQTPLVTQKVYHLYQQGLSFEEIAKRTELSTDEIELIIKQN